LIVTSIIRKTVGGLARRIGLRHDGDIVGREEDAAYYDRMYSAKSNYHQPYEKSHYYFLWSVIVDRVRRAGFTKVLEIGCGPAQLANYLVDQGIELYTGLDFSPHAIEMAKVNVPTGRFVVGDARERTIHTQVDHDVVICTEVLEHIEDDLKVVAAFTPGKTCFCSVPNFANESHVRYFKDAGEVLARYGRFFNDATVATFKSPCDPNDRFFLLQGVRSELGLEQSKHCE
jgi:SAM-dependent methyltransferase